jgi:hypothetical protein
VSAAAPPPIAGLSAAHVPATRLSGGVAGARSGLLALVLKSVALTLLTGGLYSFWARTRLRRWIWSSIRLGDAAFEYAGDPLEKAAGFAIAAVMVAFWFGAAMMLLVFLSVDLAHALEPGLAAGFVLLLPVYWIAQYRGRRYLMAHTRWRGIAFSLMPGALGYAGRAALWSALAVASLGLLVPLRRHRLFRYMAERARYGDARLRLECDARALLRPWLPVLALGWGAAGAVMLAAWRDAADPLVLLAVLGPLLLVAWANWRTASTRILLSGLGLEMGRTRRARLRVAPRLGRVLRIQLLGWLAIAAILAAIAPFASGLVVALAEDGQRAAAVWDLDLTGIEIAAGLLLFYALAFVLRGGLRLAFVTWPLIAHVAETAEASGAPALARVRAAPAARMADADGFANLFDMGAGI